MELLLLVPLVDTGDIPPGLLPIQSSWTTESWKVRITRHQLHGGLVPQAYTTLPDPAAKTREVIAVQLSHRKGTVYLYTKGIKEEIVSKSPDSLLVVEEVFLTRLMQARIISKEDTIIDLVGSIHKREDMVLYQALHTTQDSRHLLFHLRVPYTNTGPSLVQILHSGIVSLPSSVKDVTKSVKDTKPSSILIAPTATVPANKASANKNANTANLGTSSSSSTNTAASGTSQLQATSSGDGADEDIPLTEIDVLKHLPAYFSNARPIQFLPAPAKLFEKPASATTSLAPSPYPYLTSESQILRGRDRASVEETDRYTVLYYIGMILARPTSSAAPGSKDTK